MRTYGLLVKEEQKKTRRKADKTEPDKSDKEGKADKTEPDKSDKE